jgi:hypothetical protein
VRSTVTLFKIKTDIFIVLDPRINYKALLDDHGEDQEQLDFIEERKRDLESHYSLYYAGKVSMAAKALSPSAPTATNLRRTSSGLIASPEKINFTARYAVRRPVGERNELEEYFRLIPEVWSECDPVKWWASRRAQFPNLYHLARDLMTIPGMIHVL